MISLSHAHVPAHYQSQSLFMGVPVTRYAFTHSHFGVLDATYAYPLVLPQFAQR